MDAIEKRARELLADIANLPLRASDDEVVALIAAALTPPEGYVLVPVEELQDAKRFRWLKTCSREQYLLARGVFGLAEDVIDAVIQSEEMEARNG
ncbi:hypothetical protein JY448_02995 [Stenotrophomonas maltophilia]|nr:hypothetical protein [Stenotrophomonas maltophilia]